jgi:hypothetical protein
VTISEERKARVKDLYFNEKMTTRDIAKIERISLRDISDILEEEDVKRQEIENDKRQQKQQELSAKAYELFSKGKKPVEVAIALNLGEPEVSRMYREYWRLRRMHSLYTTYEETNGKLATFLNLYRLMKERGMSIEQIVNAVDIAIHRLPYMENLYKQIKEEVEKMHLIRQRMTGEIETLKNQISILEEILSNDIRDFKNDKAKICCQRNSRHRK